MSKSPKLFTRNGKLDLDDGAVCRFAITEIDTALHWARVREEDKDDVKSLVLEGVWRWWIPEARSRLKAGKWKPAQLPQKLRTALRHYARTKSATVAAKRESRERVLREFAGHGGQPLISKLDSEWNYSPDESRFLARLLPRVAETAKDLGIKNTRCLMRVLILIRRSTTGVRGGSSRWTWEHLFRKIAEIMPETLDE